jgi:hypothetical protein
MKKLLLTGILALGLANAKAEYRPIDDLPYFMNCYENSMIMAISADSWGSVRQNVEWFSDIINFKDKEQRTEYFSDPSVARMAYMHGLHDYKALELLNENSIANFKARYNALERADIALGFIQNPDVGLLRYLSYSFEYWIEKKLEKEKSFELEEIWAKNRLLFERLDSKEPYVIFSESQGK